MTDQSYDDVELSPAQRYAAARKRAEFDRSAVAAYQRTLNFELDDFQKEACQAVEDGKGVLVAAPTGAGKTVVGEFAAYQAIQERVRLMYTTPSRRCRTRSTTIS